MKHMLVFLVIAFNTTCATSNMPAKATNLEEMIRNGEDIYFENQTFEEDIDFTKILKPNMISEGIYQVRIVSSVTFKNCAFNGKVVTYNRDENRTILSFSASNRLRSGIVNKNLLLSNIIFFETDDSVNLTSPKNLQFIISQ